MNKEIAPRMGVSVRTVERHLTDLMRKSGTGGRTELLRWAIQEGLVEVAPMPSGFEVRKRKSANVTAAPAPPAGGEEALAEAQKLERRKLNAEAAKRLSLRKKFLLESLQEQIKGLQEENQKVSQTRRAPHEPSQHEPRPHEPSRH
jgi:hypothetical protein